MAVVRLFVKLLDGREAERELRRLLKRYKDSIVAVALLIELDNRKQAGALARHYRLRPAALPASILFSGEERG